MQSVTPFLWFNDNAAEAVAFYKAAFAGTAAPAAGAPGAPGMVIPFTLPDINLLAMNGGPMFAFTPATSFFVRCDSVEEADRLWAALSAGGSVLMPLQQYPFSQKYGWCNDKFGLSWQLYMGEASKKITPFLMFTREQAGHAEEAMRFYASVFPDSAVTAAAHYPPGLGEPETSLVHGDFALDGQAFMAMDSSGPHKFGFTEAVSYMVSVDTQEEVDRFWEALSAGGSHGQCGWLKDKYGVSWQVVPKMLTEVLGGPDKAGAGRAMQAMLQMTKLDIQALKDAYEGKTA